MAVPITVVPFRTVTVSPATASPVNISSSDTEVPLVMGPISLEIVLMNGGGTILVRDTDGGVVSAGILGVIEGEILAVNSPGARKGGGVPRMPVGVTDTVTWIVELPRFLLIAPNTSMENESCPLKSTLGE